MVEAARGKSERSEREERERERDRQIASLSYFIYLHSIRGRSVHGTAIASRSASRSSRARGTTISAIRARTRRMAPRIAQRNLRRMIL